MAPRKATLAVLALLPLCALASCSGETSEGTSPTNETTVVPTTTASEPHALTDTVTIGDKVVISDLAITTEGCEFASPPTREAVKFQVIATVENNSAEAITEVLWPSEIRFTDPGGFSIGSLDIAPGEPPCVNNNPREFNNMAAGEKRRAAITLEAPAGAQEMIYHTTLMEGAGPVRWDIAGEVAGMTVISPEDHSSPEPPVNEQVPGGQEEMPPAPHPTPPPAPAPAPAPPMQSPGPVIGMTGAPGADQPGPLDKQIQQCFTDQTLYQRGTTLFTDGTTGWTEHCASLSQ